jgi:metallophosphoesterase superfamily enzyme
LLGCLESSGAENVLIIGDLKHNVPLTSGQEFREIPEFISQISNRSHVEIVPGNHDGGIENLLKKEKNVVVHATGGTVIGGIGFFHGHSWPGESLLLCDTMVCAHNHPTVRLEDEIGHVRTERVWLRAPVDLELLAKKYPGVKDFDRELELIVMPAFNRRCGGLAVNREPSLIGPMFNNGIADLGHSRVFMLDGTYLGEVHAMRRDTGSGDSIASRVHGKKWKLKKREKSPND